MRLRRMSMIAAGGVGYVLGAKAGRHRYEQIRHAVQEVPHATEQARDKVEHARDKVEHAREKVMATAAKVRHGGSHAGPALDEVVPTSGPTGDLSIADFMEERPGDRDQPF
jgi:hypothetical protein